MDLYAWIRLSPKGEVKLAGQRRRTQQSFNARFRDELLNGEIFYSLKKAKIIIEQWRRHCNTKRPHSALGYRPPAPEAVVPMDLKPVMH